MGSGVLVKIGERLFIITAGHCAEECRRAYATVVAVSTARHSMDLEAIRIGAAYDKGTERDFGYIELSPILESTLDLQRHYFLRPASIMVAPPDDLAVRDWMVLAGFPVERRRLGGTPRFQCGHTFVMTVVAGQGRTIACPKEASAPEIRFIDLFGRAGTEERAVGPDLPVTAPSLSGVSGGSCWRSFESDYRDAWRPSDMRLIGIHAGTIPGEEPNTYFAREILIGHHLALIAREYPDVRDFILERWPSVADYWVPQ